MKRIILASESASRKEILSKVGIPFQAVKSEYPEDMTLDMTPEKLVAELARGKAKAVRERFPHAIVIAADTFVTFGNQRIGKPRDDQDAIRILETLSGQTHVMLTCLCVYGEGIEVEQIVKTSVTFRDLEKEEVIAYVMSGEPHGKAGAYAFQGRGRDFVIKIEGDEANIMGMPITNLQNILRQGFGIEI